MNIAERTVLDAVRILETREVGHDCYEVCATAQATCDESSGKMKVVLDAFVRRFEMRGRDDILRPPWLPRNDMVETRVSFDEAPDAAKEIFSSWAKKVRKVIPCASEWTAKAPWLQSRGHC